MIAFDNTRFVIKIIFEPRMLQASTPFDNKIILNSWLRSIFKFIIIK